MHSKLSLFQVQSFVYWKIYVQWQINLPEKYQTYFMFGLSGLTSNITGFSISNPFTNGVLEAIPDRRNMLAFGSFADISFSRPKSFLNVTPLKKQKSICFHNLLCNLRITT